MALLLWADQHRRLADRRPREPAAAARRREVRRCGSAITALVAGLVVGAVVPTLAEGSLTTGLGRRQGRSTGTALDPAAELHGQLTLPRPIDLLRLDSLRRDPGYLRAVALDQYDADARLDAEQPRRRELGRRHRPAGPAARRGQRAGTVTATIEVLGHDDRFLPVLASPLAVRIGRRRATTGGSTRPAARSSAVG